MFILHTLLANCFNIRCEKIIFLDWNPIGQKIRYKNSVEIVFMQFQ